MSDKEATNDTSNSGCSPSSSTSNSSNSINSNSKRSIELADLKQQNPNKITIITKHRPTTLNSESHKDTSGLGVKRICDMAAPLIPAAQEHQPQQTQQTQQQQQQQQQTQQQPHATVTVAKKRGRRRQQTIPDQPNGLDRVFVWDIDGSLVRSDTISDSQEQPSVLTSVTDKLGILAKKLQDLTLTFCEEHFYLSELESSDQIHIDDVPIGDHHAPVAQLSEPETNTNNQLQSQSHETARQTNNIKSEPIVGQTTQSQSQSQSQTQSQSQSQQQQQQPLFCSNIATIEDSSGQQKLQQTGILDSSSSSIGSLNNESTFNNQHSTVSLSNLTHQANNHRHSVLPVQHYRTDPQTPNSGASSIYQQHTTTSGEDSPGVWSGLDNTHSSHPYVHHMPGMTPYQYNQGHHHSNHIQSQFHPQQHSQPQPQPQPHHQQQQQQHQLQQHQTHHHHHQDHQHHNHHTSLGIGINQQHQQLNQDCVGSNVLDMQAVSLVDTHYPFTGIQQTTGQHLSIGQHHNSQHLHHHHNQHHQHQHQHLHHHHHHHHQLSNHHYVHHQHQSLQQHQQQQQQHHHQSYPLTFCDENFYLSDLESLDQVQIHENSSSEQQTQGTQLSEVDINRQQQPQRSQQQSQSQANQVKESDSTTLTNRDVQQTQEGYDQQADLTHTQSNIIYASGGQSDDQQFNNVQHSISSLTQPSQQLSQASMSVQYQIDHQTPLSGTTCSGYPQQQQQQQHTSSSGGSDSASTWTLDNSHSSQTHQGHLIPSVSPYQYNHHHGNHIQQSQFQSHSQAHNQTGQLQQQSHHQDQQQQQQPQNHHTSLGLTSQHHGHHQMVDPDSSSNLLDMQTASLVDTHYSLGGHLQYTQHQFNASIHQNHLSPLSHQTLHHLNNDQYTSHQHQQAQSISSSHHSILSQHQPQHQIEASFAPLSVRQVTGTQQVSSNLKNTKHGAIVKLRDQQSNGDSQQHIANNGPTTNGSGGQVESLSNNNSNNNLRSVFSSNHKQIAHRLSARFNRIRAVYNANRMGLKGSSPAILSGITSSQHWNGSQQQQQQQHQADVKQQENQRQQHDINEIRQELSDILSEIDHYTLDWRKRSIDCLRLISQSPNCTNVIITKLPLIIALGHLIFLGLSQYFDVDQVYSANKTSKEACIKRIRKRFGATNRCSYIIVGNREDVEMAKRLDLPHWSTSHGDGHMQLLQLFTALEAGYLM